MLWGNSYLDCLIVFRRNVELNEFSIAIKVRERPHEVFWIADISQWFKVNAIFARG